MKTRYRHCGILSKLSTDYIGALQCAQEIKDRFRDNLLRFESCAISVPLEEAVNVFDFELHESHMPFLERLHKHVRALTIAEVSEALRDNISDKKEALATANKLLDVILFGHSSNGMTATEQTDTVINFNVKDPVGDIRVTNGSDA